MAVYKPVIKGQGLFPSRFMRVIKEFTANGAAPNNGTDWFDLGDQPYKNWCLQVFGMDASGNLQTPTAWNVQVIGSMAKIGSKAILTHASGVDANGDVVFSTGSPVTAFQVVLSGLTLGASATKLVAWLEGSN